ncbi:MAG: 50S ribosomal protein L25 [Bacteroidales bacterium]|jgi:large subunit ribosomal protein L25|nr:50S ribosomal protein L25 [Bacteroidales bacterium]
MKAVSVSGSLRENVGKKDAKSLRKQGLVPCVLYGKGEQKHFSVDKRSFKNLIYTPETNYAEIDIDGTSYKAIVKDAQFHKVTDEILHVDFYEICDTKPIVVDIPLVTVGNSVGVLQGGRLVKHFRRIKVKGLYNKIPDNIEVDISHLKLHDGIVVSELEIEGVEVMENPATVVVGVLPTRQVEDTLLGDDEDEDGEETEGAEETATE